MLLTRKHSGASKDSRWEGKRTRSGHSPRPLRAPDLGTAGTRVQGLLTYLPERGFALSAVVLGRPPLLPVCSPGVSTRPLQSWYEDHLHGTIQCFPNSGHSHICNLISTKFAHHDYCHLFAIFFIQSILFFA